MPAKRGRTRRRAAPSGAQQPLCCARVPTQQRRRDRRPGPGFPARASPGSPGQEQAARADGQGPADAQAQRRPRPTGTGPSPGPPPAAAARPRRPPRGASSRRRRRPRRGRWPGPTATGSCRRCGGARSGRCSPRDRGPIKKLARDYVDAHRRPSEFYMYALIVLVVALVAGKSHKAINSDLQFLLLAIIAVIIVDALLLRRSIASWRPSGCRASRPAASRSTRSCARCSCGASATRRRGSSPATRSRPPGRAARPGHRVLPPVLSPRGAGTSGRTPCGCRRTG